MPRRTLGGREGLLPIRRRPEEAGGACPYTLLLRAPAPGGSQLLRAGDRGRGSLRAGASLQLRQRAAGACAAQAAFLERPRRVMMPMMTMMMAAAGRGAVEAWQYRHWVPLPT